MATASLATFIGLLAGSLVQGCADSTAPAGVKALDASVASNADNSTSSASIDRIVRINGVVDPHIPEFAASIGSPDNLNEPGLHTTGRRQINWDGVKAPFLNNDEFPEDFFNKQVPRGAIYEAVDPREDEASGQREDSELRVDNDHFDDINPTYDKDLIPFSEPSMFAAPGTNRVEVEFRIPGTQVPAVVKSFGAVVVDVDKPGVSRLQCFDRDGRKIADISVPVREDPDEYSLVGVTFTRAVIAKVVLVLGDTPLGHGINDVSSGGSKDVVVLDDIIYSEPRPVVPIERIVQLSGVVDPHVPEFAASIGNPNNGNEPGLHAAGRREVNWDGVAAPFLNNDEFPRNFFNRVVPRGSVYTAVGGETEEQEDADDTELRVDNDQFGGINPTYEKDLIPFSVPSMFAATETNRVRVTFRIPGSTTAAVVRSFGAIVVDVDKPGVSRLKCFDRHGTLIADIEVPVRKDPDEYSLVGVTFEEPVIARVVLVLGDTHVGRNVNDVSSGGSKDVVVLDDVLYSEPQPLSEDHDAKIASSR